MAELQYRKLVVGPLEANCYILYSQGEGIVVDPGWEAQRIGEEVERLGLSIRCIVNTHAHFDHFGASAQLSRQLRAPVAMHPEDLMLLRHPYQREAALSAGYALEEIPEPELLLGDGDEISVGKVSFTVIHTPGHTPGSICLYSPGYLITGDTLFAFGIGRTDYPLGDEEALFRSLERLFSLPEQTLVLPGHGEEALLGQCMEFLQSM